MGGKRNKKPPLIKDPIRYKTRLCANDPHGIGGCPYEWKCQFAHGMVELRKRNDVKDQFYRIQFEESYCPMIPKCASKTIHPPEPVNLDKHVSFVDLLARSLLDQHI